MTLPVLRKIDALVEQGATVIGPKPVVSPSLSDDAAQFAQTVARTRITESRDPDGALASLGVVPDVEFKADADIRFLHRRLADGDVYFLTNRRDRLETIDATFRIVGKRPEIWRADSGAVQLVGFRIDSDRTQVSLRFDPHEAYFVVFRSPAAETTASVALPNTEQLAKLDGDWSVNLASNEQTLQLGSWTQHQDAAIRHFSGTATYSRTIDVPRGWTGRGRLVLDLGDVRELAEVLINGRSVGIAWHPPFRVDVSDALKRGKNRLEIRVTNLWVNRLIGDAQPGAQKVTFTTDPPYLPNAPLRPSGLMGPVVLERIAP